MRAFLLLFCCFYLLACQTEASKIESVNTNRYLVHLKDSVLKQTIREYMDTFHLHHDSIMIKIYETSCWENHELVFQIDYNKFEDLVIRPGDLPAYYTFIDSTLVTIYNNSFDYIDSSSIEQEVRSIVKNRNIHLRKSEDYIFDPPLWTIRRKNDSVAITRRHRR